MHYSFGEGENEICEEEDKSCQNEDSKVKLFHTRSKTESNIFLVVVTFETVLHHVLSKIFSAKITLIQNQIYHVAIELLMLR